MQVRLGEKNSKPHEMSRILHIYEGRMPASIDLALQDAYPGVECFIRGVCGSSTKERECGNEPKPRSTCVFRGEVLKLANALEAANFPLLRMQRGIGLLAPVLAPVGKQLPIGSRN